MLWIWNNRLYSPLPFYCKKIPVFPVSKDLIKKTKQKPPQTLDAGLGLPVTCFADWQCQVSSESFGHAVFKPKTWHLTRSTSSPVHIGLPPCPPDNPLTEMDYKPIGWESNRGWLSITSAPAAPTAPRRTRGSWGNAQGQECRWLWEAAAVRGPVPCVCRLDCKLPRSTTTASPVSASWRSGMELQAPSRTHGLFKTKDIHSPYRGRISCSETHEQLPEQQGRKLHTKGNYIQFGVLSRQLK